MAMSRREREYRSFAAEHGIQALDDVIRDGIKGDATDAVSAMSLRLEFGTEPDAIGPWCPVDLLWNSRQRRAAEKAGRTLRRQGGIAILPPDVQAWLTAPSPSQRKNDTKNFEVTWWHTFSPDDLVNPPVALACQGGGVSRKRHGVWQRSLVAIVKAENEEAAKQRVYDAYRERPAEIDFAEIRETTRENVGLVDYESMLRQELEEERRRRFEASSRSAG